MNSAPAGRPDRVLALISRLAGGARGFLLRPGSNRVGRLPSNEIVLRAPGVSQRHANLQVNASAVLLEDLASKNGTFLNGQSVAQGRVAVGDEIRFGSLRTQLELVDPEDGWLGIDFGQPQAGQGESSSQRVDTLTLSWARGADEFAAHRWLQLVEELAWILSASSNANLVLALRRLVAGMSLDGAAVLQIEADGATTIPAMVGDSHASLANLDLGPWLGESDAGHPISVSRVVTTGEGEKIEPPLWLARAFTPDEQPIMLAVWGDPSSRVVAKPLLGTVVHLVARSDGGERRRGLGALPPEAETLKFPPRYIAGSSPSMQRLYEEIRSVAPSDLPVLVLGETGSGKELIATTIHASSRRAEGPFVAVNCAAIPDDLLEAELFGIGSGVATGVNARAGRFAEADGGTLFLDEVGDMPPALQVKLLRAFEDKKIQPLGRDAVAVDVRIVAATNMALDRHPQQSSLRQDLYYRLAGDVVRIPPLRERRSDIPDLVEHFFETSAREAGKKIRGVTFGALQALVQRPWPGNVRELEHCVRRLTYLCPDGDAIGTALIDRLGEQKAPSEPQVAMQPHSVADQYGGSQRPAALEPAALENLELAEVERLLIAEALQRTGGNKAKAAKLLGISRTALYRKLK